MKILIISFSFPPYVPPYNVIGAVRVGKLAKYLTLLGHEVKVLTVVRLSGDGSSVEMDARNVHRTSWLNLNCLGEFLLGGKKKLSTQGDEVPDSAWGKFLSLLKQAHVNLINIPDAEIGWFPFAVAEGKRLIQAWRPDVIYGSSPPITSLLIAARLHDILAVPAVFEFRDLWVDNDYPNYRRWPWRKRFDCALEKWVIQRASALVTVSEPLADLLRQRYRKSTHVLPNGYDPEEYQPLFESTFNRTVTRNLTITYTGRIYEGIRDPSPLFSALQILGDNARTIEINFVGWNFGSIQTLSQRFPSEAKLTFLDSVYRGEALKLQRQSDILLFLVGKQPLDSGAYTGKLFEYLANRRPILGIGSADNVAIKLITERNAGFCSLNAEEIACRLRDWMIQKSEEGQITDLPESVSGGFDRRSQAETLSHILEEAVQHPTCANRT